MIAVESSAWNLEFNSDNDRATANYNFGNFLSRVILIIEIIYFTRKNRGALMAVCHEYAYHTKRIGKWDATVVIVFW